VCYVSQCSQVWKGLTDIAGALAVLDAGDIRGQHCQHEQNSNMESRVWYPSSKGRKPPFCTSVAQLQTV
jgi:hypothetical protein